MKANDHIYCVKPTNGLIYLDHVQINYITNKGIILHHHPGTFDPANFYSPKFNVGDKIRCRVIKEGKLDPNTTYTVKDISGGDCIYIDDIRETFYIWRFVPEYLLTPPPCTDCKGSGQYIGLFTVDVCQTCKGKQSPIADPTYL